MNKKTRYIFLLASIFSLNNVQASPVLELEYAKTTLVNSLRLPWSMIDVNTDEWLVTERDGHIVHVTPEGSIRHHIPLDNLYVKSQGGLMDIIKGPDFDLNGTLYLSYSKGSQDTNHVTVGKVTFNGKVFTPFETVFEMVHNKHAAVHYGARLLLLPDNTLLVTTGDAYDLRELPQLLDNQHGKILRFNLDGSIPHDNPYANHENPNVRPVYSLGHRNPQGLIYDPISEQIYQHEHGPAGGDEINIIEPTVNYGWPIITYGKDYSGALITPFKAYGELRQPEVDWTPSIAPSGMALYNKFDNAPFPQLQRHLLVTTLVDKKLYSIDLAEDYKQHQVFPDILGRLRDVYVTDDGRIAVLTDGEEASLLLVTDK